MAIRKLSRKEVIKVNELLTLHLKPSSREGFFKYEDDWDDKRIAGEIGTDVQATAIGRLCENLSLNKVVDVRHLA